LTRKAFPLISLAAAALAFHLHAEEMAFAFDPAQTQIAFKLSSTLHTVHGMFQLRSGMVRFDPATGKASGELIVTAASGESGNSSRDERMHKSILETQRFPDIVFRPDRVEGTLPSSGSAMLQVHGTFGIHGLEHEMTIPAQVETQQDRITAAFEFGIPYIKWGMKNPSTLFLRVADQAQVEIHAVVRRVGEQAGR
jgi:polyisoprenoid-binding protein YceI